MKIDKEILIFFDDKYSKSFNLLRTEYPIYIRNDGEYISDVCYCDLIDFFEKRGIWISYNLNYHNCRRLNKNDFGFQYYVYKSSSGLIRCSVDYFPPNEARKQAIFAAFELLEEELK